MMLEQGETGANTTFHRSRARSPYRVAVPWFILAAVVLLVAGREVHWYAQSRRAEAEVLAYMKARHPDVANAFTAVNAWRAGPYAVCSWTYTNPGGEPPPRDVVACQLPGADGYGVICSSSHGEADGSPYEVRVFRGTRDEAVVVQSGKDGEFPGFLSVAPKREGAGSRTVLYDEDFDGIHDTKCVSEGPTDTWYDWRGNAGWVPLPGQQEEEESVDGDAPSAGPSPG
jgi:hypothetical protein